MNSEQCEHYFQDQGGISLRCQLPKGHDAPHESGDWEWKDELSIQSDAAVLEAYKKRVSDKLSHVADSCEASGHTSRAKMFRAVRDELGSLADGDSTERSARESGLPQ